MIKYESLFSCIHLPLIYMSTANYFKRQVAKEIVMKLKLYIKCRRQEGRMTETQRAMLEAKIMQVNIGMNCLP